jgi:hypothetical protein
MNGRDGFAREILLAGFGARRFVYAVEEKNAGEFEVSGVVVLRDPSGERLTADTKAAAIIQERFDNCDLRRDSEVRFRFRGYGNGVAFATARIRELVERVQGYVYDETGRTIENLEKAGDLVQKEWRRELHSRKGRDVMHLIVSARAGTHISAFHAAVRDFLGEQFDGHRYVFALHDPSDDPKERRQGGRRPHIHAHAIVTMRSERGERIVTGPQVFREWRASMAEKAREHGIEMEFTDRRDLASPPAYTRNQVRPVSYAGRTEHEGTSRAAQTRYGTKRANRHTVARSDCSIGYAVEAARFWAEVVRAAPGKAVRDFAAAQIGRLQMALRESQLTFGTFENSLNGKSLKANMVELGNVVAAGGNSMRTMTLTEFEAYEKRVEAVLATVEAAIEPVEKKDFDEIAKIAREVVSIRREYLELTERKPHDAGTRQQGADVRNVEWERAPAGGGSETVVHGNDRMPEEETARGARNRATRDGRDPSNAGADIERELANAARPSIAVNSRLRETAKSDQGRPGPMDGLERSDNLPDVEDERASVSDGSKSLPGPAGSTSTAASAESDQHAQQLSRSEINDQLEDSAIAQDAKREMRGRERREEAHDIRRLADERFNPKPQQVPRVRELEREVEQRRHHERDEQDR